MKNLIFLSHATADVDLVDRFVDFLEIAFKIKRSEIYCTSLEGTKSIRTGNNFIADIKENIKGTELVLFFLTPNYMKSDFCLSELGAAWALGKRIYPILVPPLDYDDLDGTPLKGVTQFKKIDNEKSIHQIFDEFNEMGLVPDVKTGLLRVKTKSFLKDMPGLVRLPEVDQVDKAVFSQMKEDLDEITENNVQQEEEIRDLKKKVEEIKALKDADQVTAIEIDNLDEWGKLETYIDDVKDELKSLDSIVVSALYHNDYLHNEFGFWPTGDDWSTVRKLAAEKYIEINEDDREVVPNYEDFSIQEASKRLNCLSEFLEDRASMELIEIFAKMYRQNLDLTSKRFWEAFFEVNIIMN